jgi:RimJ/RimL family protein N-acetyltransferase
MIVAADDVVFAGLAAGVAPAGLVLAEGGLETGEVMAMLRTLAVVVRRQFEPAAWLVVEAGEVVGLCSLKNAPDAFGAVEIGYGVAPAWRARGVATRAVADVLDWARGDARVAAVTAETSVENRASQLVLERNGFARIGNRDDDEDGALICWECRVVGQ